MKYPKWNEYSNSTKWKAVADEVELETHNGTTKADLVNIIKFLAGESARLQARVYELEERLAIGEFGEDKIDELEEALEIANFRLRRARDKGFTD